jgi:hypothetical protein
MLVCKFFVTGYLDIVIYDLRLDREGKTVLGKFPELVSFTHVFLFLLKSYVKHRFPLTRRSVNKSVDFYQVQCKFSVSLFLFLKKDSEVLGAILDQLVVHFFFILTNTMK